MRSIIIVIVSSLLFSMSCGEEDDYSSFDDVPVTIAEPLKTDPYDIFDERPEAGGCTTVFDTTECNSYGGCIWMFDSCRNLGLFPPSGRCRTQKKRESCVNWIACKWFPATSRCAPKFRAQQPVPSLAPTMTNITTPNPTATRVVTGHPTTSPTLSPTTSPTTSPEHSTIVPTSTPSASPTNVPTSADHIGVGGWIAISIMIIIVISAITLFFYGLYNNTRQ